MSSDPAFVAVKVPRDSISAKEAPEVAIEKSQNAMLQNAALGVLLTIAFCFDNSIGSRTFDVKLYVGAILAGFGVINVLPRFIGKPPGSVGGFALLASSAKVIAVAVGSTRIGGA